MISIVCSTKEPKDSFKEHVIKTCGLGDKVEFLFYKNLGEYSLTEIYNKGLESSKYNVVVFLHDDIEIKTKQWGEKLLKHYKRNPEYGVLGVAGSKYLPESGKWWENPKSMYGQVYHTHEGKTWLSKYSDSIGNKLDETVIVDGVFFSVNKLRLKHKFDEDIEGFHFYDVEFSFNNHLSGVKVGVHYNIKINHYSIGQTNDQWEENRKQFSEYYKEELPRKVNVIYDDITTYIVCHDQDIILRQINEGKYSSLGNVQFLFVGYGEIDKLSDNDDIIIVRNLENNIERYKNLTAFTAWYIIWKHNLCKTKYINLFEYDVNINDLFKESLNTYLSRDYKVINYFPSPMRGYHYISNPNWVTGITKGLSEIYRIDLKNMIGKYIEFNLQHKIEPIWCSTNNVCFRYDVFKSYMKWVNPLINYIKDDIYGGHNQERLLSIYSLINKIRVEYLTSNIEHVQADSHKTQGHKVEGKF